MKTGAKRFLAIALAIVMIMSVAPLSFAEERHPSYGSVSVSDKENLGHYFNTNNHYYKNDAASCTNDPEGANVSYDQETGIMVLNNFDGGTIKFNDYGDVTIIVKGTNNINGYQFGIYCGYGNLTVTAEEDAVLNITTSTSDSGGIVTSWNPSTDYNLTIAGNLNVNVNNTVSGDFDGIRAGGKLSILDNANVSVKGTSDVDYCHIYGLRGASLFLDTTGTVSVETGDTVYYCYALSFTAVEIKNVKEFNIKSKGSSRTCIIYNSDAYNSLINSPGFDVVSETDEDNHYFITIKKHNHSFDDVVVTAPTANAVGYTTHTCACGYSYKDGFKAPTGKPSGVKCIAKTAAAEKITWNKVSGVTGYQAQILNSAGKSVELKTTTANTYVFTKLASGHAYKVRVRFYFKADDGKNYFSQWTTISSPTLPKATKLTSVAGSAKAFTAKWSKQSGVTGYQIQYATNSKFTSAKVKAVKGAAKYSLKVSSLKAKTTYYVRVRTFKTIGGTNYFSTWSAVKSVKTK